MDISTAACSTSIYSLIILCLTKLRSIRVGWVEPIILSFLLSTGHVFLRLVIVSVAVVSHCDYTSFSVTLCGEGWVGWPLGIICSGDREGDGFTMFCVVLSCNSQFPHMCPLRQKEDINTFHVGTVWNSYCGTTSYGEIVMEIDTWCTCARWSLLIVTGCDCFWLRLVFLTVGKHTLCVLPDI
jgi:hypothetical protein